jgi:hypothetical protein
VSRWTALARIKVHFPFIIPFLGKIYGEDSQGWYFGHNSEEARSITGIPSLEGVHQGDVLGSWIHCMATLPFVKELKDKVGEQGSSKFFIDDANLTAPYDQMLSALDHVFAEGPEVGYHLKRDKGVYLLGRCKDRAEAMRRKCELMAKYSFESSMIRIHPDNGGDKLLYGAKVLGSFVGTEESIANRLEKKLAKLKKEADAITCVSSFQIRLLLLRWCFGQMIIFLQRTIPPKLIDTYLEPGFTELKKLVLNSILGKPNGIPLKSFALAELHIQDSGLGLFHSSDTSKAAFLASFVECSDDLASLLSPDEAQVDTVLVQEATRCFEYFQQVDPTLTQDSLRKIASKSKSGIGDSTLQHYLSQLLRASHRAKVVSEFYDPREVAWLESLQDPHAGLWLDTVPKTEMHRLPNDQFRVALTLRLYLPQKCILPATMCDCRKGKNEIPLDRQGIHLTTGCIKGGNSIHNHDRVKEQAVKILSYCGLSTKVEERNAFRGYDEDNGNRPDITIFNHPDHPGKFFLDVRLSSPVPANSGRLELSDAKKKFRSGNKAFSEKVKAYKHATDQGLGFLPIIFETTGQMHPDTQLFFMSCLEQAARVRQIKLAVLWKY